MQTELQRAASPGGCRAGAPRPKSPDSSDQVMHRVVTRHLLGKADLKVDEADSRGVTRLQPSL